MTKDEKAEIEALFAENRQLIAKLNRVTQKCKKTLDHLKYFPSGDRAKLKN